MAPAANSSATMQQEKVHVKFAILNNGFLGMVRQWQDLFHKKNYVATPLTGPDFVMLAQAYGIQAERVTRKADVTPALERAMAHDGSYLVEFVVETDGPSGLGTPTFTAEWDGPSFVPFVDRGDGTGA